MFVVIPLGTTGFVCFPDVRKSRGEKGFWRGLI